MTEARGILYVVGIGPGAGEHATPAALAAIGDAEVIVGYTTYIKLVRHLIGGKLDCFSCTAFNRTRHGAWKKATFLNERHMLYAWASLISVGFADFYVRMVASGMIKDLKIL